MMQMAKHRIHKHVHFLQTNNSRLVTLCITSLFLVGFLGIHVSSGRGKGVDVQLLYAKSLSFSCAENAASAQPSAETSSQLLAYQSRELPSVMAGSPVLSASNWEGIANPSHAESTQTQLREACGAHVSRYRIVNRVVYTDGNYGNDDMLKGHKDTFLEMLLTAVWLYKSFPDVELWVSFADEPSRCTLDVPVLQYTVIGLQETRAALKSNLVKDKDGSYFSVSNLLTGGGDLEDSSAPAPRFARGWAMNYPYAWETLSYLPDSLARYQSCLSSQIGGRPDKSKLIWRGGNTGGRRGWASLSGPQSQPLRHPWAVALTNKRMALALLARSHSDIMDVGLHYIAPELMGPEGSDKQLLADLQDLLIRPFSPQETWGSFALQLSIDGHGSPNRLPLQYLQGSSVILKMTSPYKDSFEELFKPGVHYEPCKYDMSDIVPRTQELLQQFKAGNTGPFAKMAAAAAAKAVDVFNMLGQLDALMYAVLKVKDVCKWEVHVPTLKDTTDSQGAHIPAAGKQQEWEMLVLERGLSHDNWKSPTLRAAWAQNIRASIAEKLHKNIKAVTS